MSPGFLLWCARRRTFLTAGESGLAYISQNTINVIKQAFAEVMDV